jgi:glycosyltransferase involved in cell wall biosynthesis
LVSDPIGLSVLSPVYKGERYIREPIDSILRQTYPHFEFVIVNDGSTDSTPRILDHYASLDARIRVINQSNQDQPRALNTGITAARHDWVAIIDHDDISEPQRLERQVATLRANPTVRAVGGYAHEIDAEGRVVGAVPLGPTSVAAFRRLRDEDGWVILVHSAVIFHRETVLRLGGYRPAFGSAADSDLWSRLSDEHDIVTVPEYLVRYRIHLNSMSYTRFFEQQEVVRWIRACQSERRAGRPEPTLAQVRERERRPVGMGRLRTLRYDWTMFFLRRRRVARWEGRETQATALFILASTLDPGRSARRIYQRVSRKNASNRTAIEA